MQRTPVLNYYGRPRAALEDGSVLTCHGRPRRVRSRYPRTDHEIERLVLLLKLAAAAILIVSASLAYCASGLVSSNAFRNFIDTPSEEPPVHYIVIPVRG